MLKIIKKIQIYLFLLRNRFWLHKTKKVVKFLNYDITIEDFNSFYYEMIYIFKDEIYNFKTEKEIPVIIDGGACIGTSIFYFKNKYPNSKIIAFEPSSEVFNILNKNIINNKLKDIKLINKGLYDITGELSFSNNEVDSGKIDFSGQNKITVVKLSDYIKEKIDFLKLNIEGAEYQVLKDLDESKKIKYVKEICFEWHSFKGQVQNLDKILHILQNNNFKYYISSLSTSVFGKFKAEKDTEYFIMIYAKQIN